MEKGYHFFSHFKVVTAISVFAIMVSLFVFYFILEERQSEQSGCGVVDERSYCGNSIRRMRIGGILNKTGEGLFKANCMACHDVNYIVVGPALKNVEKRRSKKWLYKFINNSGAVIKSRDPYAVELFNQFNKIEKPKYNFTKAQIDSILDYIKYESVY